MSSTHNIHPHQPAQVIVERYREVNGIYVEIKVNADDFYIFHFPTPGEAIQFGYRIYQQATALADRMNQSQPTPTEKDNVSTINS